MAGSNWRRSSRSRLLPLVHREDSERIAKLPEWIRSIEAFRTENEPNVIGLGGLTRSPRLDDAEAVKEAFLKAKRR
jgi:hypothetical protein